MLGFGDTFYSSYTCLEHESEDEYTPLKEIFDDTKKHISTDYNCRGKYAIMV
jgi:hypothetical protein